MEPAGIHRGLSRRSQVVQEQGQLQCRIHWTALVVQSQVMLRNKRQGRVDLQLGSKGSKTRTKMQANGNGCNDTLYP